ncbi:unnamed protein product [Arabis nemorensis]|uniref:Armadillo repeat-containing domain-containing protein n=1 Tax=Arabis nemorensis TaxID=586526 RepID=A0A565BJ51_9BRAS|nr:unnamed protein product [Arabis nemorensis]
MSSLLSLRTAALIWNLCLHGKRRSSGTFSLGEVVKIWRILNARHARRKGNMWLEYINHNLEIKPSVARRRHLSFWSKTSVTLWIVCFFRQFFGSVTKVDYLALRHGFITLFFSGAFGSWEFRFPKKTSKLLLKSEPNWVLTNGDGLKTLNTIYCLAPVETKERIVANLANFAYDPYNYTILRQLNVLELFIDCITEPNEKLVDFGIGGICNACAEPKKAATIVEADGIPLIIKCLFSPVRNTVSTRVSRIISVPPVLI